MSVGAHPASDSAAMLHAQNLTLIEMRVANEAKSTGTAYLLWFFLGMFGAHRFYMRKTGTAILQLILTLTFFGAPITLLWILIDAFLIPGWIEAQKAETRDRLIKQLAGWRA